VARYRTDQVPVNGAGAFMPSLTTNPGASSHGLVGLDGWPGTTPIPAPHPASTAGASPGGTKAMRTQGSHAGAPDEILPAIYIPRARNMGPSDGALGIMVKSDNVLPVPAIDPGRAPAAAFRPAKVGGRSQVAWPRTTVTWPTGGTGST